MTTDNRTNEPSDEQVEAAAKAMHGTGNPWFAAYGDWGAAGFEIKQAFRESARAALLAAAPIPQPVLDLEKVAAVIDREFDDYQPMYPADGSRCIDSNAARALCEAAKRGELSHVNPIAISPERVKNVGDSLHVASQEPNQNETKSGNNFVSLDSEKVADVLRLAMRAEAMMFEDGGYEWIAESDPDDCLPHIARALCEAYTEGKLT